MNAQRQTNTWIKGMNCDLDYSVISSDQYQWAENIRIIAVEKNDEIIIDLDFKSIQLNGEIRFPFNIPSGYKEIELE